MKIYKISTNIIKAYHGMCEKYYDIIEYSGLKNPYLARDIEIAEYYAEQTSEISRYGKPIILEVDILDVNNLKYDRNSMEEPIMFENEANRAFEEVSKNHPEWIEDEYLIIPDTEWEISWNAVGAAKYHGTIPIENIRIVK